MDIQFKPINFNPTQLCSFFWGPQFFHFYPFWSYFEEPPTLTVCPSLYSSPPISTPLTLLFLVFILKYCHCLIFITYPKHWALSEPIWGPGGQLWFPRGSTHWHPFFADPVSLTSFPTTSWKAEKPELNVFSLFSLNAEQLKLNSYVKLQQCLYRLNVI